MRGLRAERSKWSSAKGKFTRVEPGDFLWIAWGSLQKPAPGSLGGSYNTLT